MPSVFEFKAQGKPSQYKAIDQAIRTGQFIRNKCLRLWMDSKATSRNDLYKHCKVLAHDFPFAKNLNSTARQAMSERTWASISRFYENCKKKVSGKKAENAVLGGSAVLGSPQVEQLPWSPQVKRFSKTGYPKFKHNSRSVEYKHSGWKLSDNRKQITFTDKIGIGKLKLKGTWDLHFYQISQIKRVRLIKRADGYYVQFVIDTDVSQKVEPTSQTIGLDVGLKDFYTDSNGNTEPNPLFYRNSEKRLKFYQRRVSRKKKGSSNRNIAINKLGRVHLKISRRREEHAKRVARCVILSNDMVAYEDLRIKNLVKNHCLAKSINDAGWYQFRKWLEYFGKKFGKATVAVNPAYTSQKCSSCGSIVKKSLSTRTHVCKCGCELDRDHNAAINILSLALGTVGHTGTLLIERNASGDSASTETGANLSQQAGS